MTLNDNLRTPAPPPPVPGPPVVYHHGVGYRVRNYFLTGLIVAGPLAITVYLTWSFITWVDDLVRPFMPVALRPETYLPWKLPGTGLVIPCLALTGGFFFEAPRAELIERDIPVEARAKLIMRAGLIQPNGGPDQQKKLSALADAARAARAPRESPATVTTE